MNAALIPDDLYGKERECTRRLGEHLLGGRWQPAKSGASFEVVDPSNGRTFAHAAAGDAADIDAAVKAARAAFDGPWGMSMPAFRARLLLKLADLIEANGDELALLETLDNRMPFRMARMVAAFGAAESLRYHAGSPTKIGGETVKLSRPPALYSYTHARSRCECG